MKVFLLELLLQKCELGDFRQEPGEKPGVLLSFCSVGQVAGLDFPFKFLQFFLEECLDCFLFSAQKRPFVQPI